MPSLFLSIGFKLTSHSHLHTLQEEFVTAAKHDHVEVMECLSAMKDSQTTASDLLHNKVDATQEAVLQLMSMMQDVRSPSHHHGTQLTIVDTAHG